MGLAADERPALDAATVAGLPVSVFESEREAGLDNKVHAGSILKANGNAVILAGGKEFNVFQWFAPGFFKAVEVAAFIAANCGLATARDDGSGQGRKPTSFAGFASGLRTAGRAFTFNGSHVASLLGDLVRVAFGVDSTGAARSTAVINF